MFPMRLPGLLVLVLVATSLDVAAIPPEEPDPPLPANCQMTTDYPPSHMWCDTGVIRVDCWHTDRLQYSCY